MNKNKELLYISNRKLAIINISKNSFNNMQLTVDGFESQMAVNHLSHFLLTSLLLPYMAENGRIINHSSLAHSFAEKNFVENNLMSEKSYKPFQVRHTYKQTYVQ